MQTIMNNVENEGEENKSVLTDSDRNSVYSNWSELISVNEEVKYSKLNGGLNVDVSTSNASLGEAMKTMLTQPRKRTVKNIVLVPYKAKPTEWGSWKIKSPYATSTIASPSFVPNDHNKNN